MDVSSADPAKNRTRQAGTEDLKEAIMLKKALVLSIAAVAALSLPASAGGPGGDDRGTRTVVLQRGRWDGNGPDMLGTAGDDRGTRLYHRGGWDANGPAVTGANNQVPQAETNLEGLSVDSIELPQTQAVMRR